MAVQYLFWPGTHIRIYSASCRCKNSCYLNEFHPIAAPTAPAFAFTALLDLWQLAKREL